MNKLSPVVFVTAGLLAAGGCKSGGEKTQAAAQVRPVLSVVVSHAQSTTRGFAGTIQPQYQTDRAFQVLGRIVSRDVDVGDVVEAGQVLATLDPLAFDLAVRSSEADLAKAKSELANAVAAEERRSTLLGKNVISQSEYDTAQQTRAAAAASEQQAIANLDKAREQLSYTKLIADIAGVVTSTAAEVGQTVSAGQKVMTVARTDIREAVVDLPEEVASALTVGAPFDITLQADTAIKTSGKVREIAPQADTATRTRRVKITLDQIFDAFRLGVTITATSLGGVAEKGFEIPVTAILDADGAPKVWLVDPAAKTVKTVAVEVAGRNAQSVRVVSGLSEGARIVVAGVHSLAEGQSVNFTEGETR